MRPTYEDVHRLVLKMRGGSTEARRDLIEAHVGLAFKVASNYEDDEVLSELLCKLVEAVDEFRTLESHPAALPSFLKRVLRDAATGMVRNDRGDGVRVNVRHCAHNDAVRFLKSGRSLPEWAGLKTVDLMDQILSACESDQEREMVYWKSQGMTYAEVALRIGASTTHVARSMSKLSLRFGVQERLHA